MPLNHGVTPQSQVPGMKKLDAWTVFEPRLAERPSAETAKSRRGGPLTLSRLNAAIVITLIASNPPSLSGPENDAEGQRYSGLLRIQLCHPLGRA